jgi:hypothetical protein
MSGSRAWLACTQVLPTFFIAIGLFGGWISLVGSCGRLLYCMDISASDVYRLTADNLHQICWTGGSIVAGR